MLYNKLKLNQDKTELLVVSSRHWPRPPLNHTQIGDDVINPCEHARNLGVGFDQYFDFSEHVKMTCKMAFFRVCSIGKTRRHLSHDTAKTIVHAYITARLDYCNALYHGLPKYLIDKLQLLQNSAARLVIASRKHDHIAPILRRLHWPPVLYRIICKILLLTYKALTVNHLATSKICWRIGTRAAFYDLQTSICLTSPCLNQKPTEIGHTPLLLQNSGISYHWTLGYHRQLLYWKLSSRHICLRILLT